MKFNNRNILVSPKARIGKNVKIGDNCAIYDNVEIGDDSIICNDCTIGEPLAGYYQNSDYQNPPTVIGPNSVIRSHSIIYAACTIGPRFCSGHRITIRENSTIGEDCSIGTMSDIQGNVRMGNYCRLHSNVHIAHGCSIGDCVFLYPFSVMTNDPCPPSTDIQGGRIGNYTVVGVHAVILPRIQVGENCLIGANSVVNKRLPDYSLAMGDPVKIVMDIRKFVVMGKGTPYPWMNRFDRGMPWEGLGFELWNKQNGERQAA